MSQPSTVGPGRKLFFPPVRVDRIYKIADICSSSSGTWPVQQESHKASLVELGFHSQEMLDLLDLTVSKGLICE